MILSQDSVKDSIIVWNNLFPYDRLYRKKYKIPYNSLEHRNICQIDVFFDIIEDRIFDKYYEKNKQKIENEEKYYSKGLLLNEEVESNIGKELFDKLKI